MTHDPRATATETTGALSAHELASLVESALVLQRAAAAGASRLLLRGRKFGLVLGSDSLSSEDAPLFDRAATELGAQVAFIRPDLTEQSPARDMQQTAHMLGRLYDAVICEGVSAEIVRRLNLEAGVPVHDRLIAASQPIAQAVGLLDHTRRPCDNRRFALQALLLRAAD